MLVAIDGIRFKPERLDALLLHGRPGDRIKVSAFRRDELTTFDVQLAPAPEEVCQLAVDMAATPEAAALRDGWLRGNP